VLLFAKVMEHFVYHVYVSAHFFQTYLMHPLTATRGSNHAG
jgi:hypothetical protein